jgi:hypothetical protein
VADLGPARLGRQGVDGWDWRVVAGQARLGVALHDEARHGEAGQAGLGRASHGESFEARQASRG